MMARSQSVLRDAWSLLTVRFVCEQTVLAVAVFLLSILWLRVPDASAVDVIGSVLLGLVVLATVGEGEAFLILRLAGRERTRTRFLRGAASVLVGILLWFLWSALVGYIQGDDSLRAGYLNSRFPHSLRNVFSYEHILLLFSWMWTALQWIGAGVIAIAVFAVTASAGPARAIAHALRSLAYWVALIVAAIGASVFTGLLVQWTPAHGIGIEMLSLVLRLGAATLLDISCVCFVLAILAVLVRESDAIYSTPAGTPDESQPRTVDMP